MALWVCGGEAGCGTKYAVGLFRCPRCHNTEFFEDGDPMGKISRHGGASVVPEDAAVAEPVPTEAAAADQPEPAAEDVQGEHGPELVDLPDSGAVFPTAAVEEGGEESSLGSSSSASTEPQPTNSEPSVKPRRKPARTTGSRSGKGLTESGSASSTDGTKTDESSTADGSE
ncbi:hypothetical protein [Streptomyces ossamyceticus]|uniref:hypothetical protein n=1 Tax=Streptomyces ossamyceticus TaxID=249581 RepID=UPI00341441D3